MNIQVQESAKKDLKKLDKLQALKILQAIQKLKDFPHVTNIKKLKSYYPPLRYRVGNYRILFEIIDESIIIVNIKHRKEAYD